MRVLIATLTTLMISTAAAQAASDDPTDKDPADAATLRACVVEKGARAKGCIKTVMTTCIKAVGNEYDSTLRDCALREEAAWDTILNETYQALRHKLGAAEFAFLRQRQRAWIREKDRCHKISEQLGGTMALPLVAGCLNRESGERAILLLGLAAKAQAK